MKFEGTDTGVIAVAVAGNPNCGKTTVFNGLTGSDQRIGNWPGVTVEKKEGIIRAGGRKIKMVDLPGIYSLSAYSEDEKVARNYILSGEPKLVVNIIDSTNIERNLFLTTQLIEMKVPLLVVLNMMDMAEKNRIKIDPEHMAKHLGCPVIGISAVRKQDLELLKTAIAEAAVSGKIPEAGIAYPNEMEEIISEWEPLLREEADKIGTNPRWVALKLLEQDEWVTRRVVKDDALKRDTIENGITRIEGILKDTPDVIIADYKYGFIHGVSSHIVRETLDRESMTDRIDRVVMNRFFGIPIFLLAMYFVFWLTMSIGGAFIDFFDILFGTIFVDGFGALLGRLGSPGWLTAFLADGIGGGLQTVSTFVPIIFVMFFCLSLLEDSGYMARAAFVMDRFMRFIGLPGKSFIPMIVGFGCTVPAIMATRTLESRKDRYLTIFMTPLMSCGARLPVYALFGAAFFGAAAGGVVFSIYIAGVAMAILTGLLLKNTLFKGENSHFILELPPYHAPRMRHIMLHTWHRLKTFMFRAGKVIIIAVALLGFLNSMGTDGSFGNQDAENSVLSRIGMTITPVFGPMGIEKENWPATVALFSGIFAKEAVVGTLDALYSQMDALEIEEDEEEFSFFGGILEALEAIPGAFRGIAGSLTDPLGMGLLTEEAAGIAEEAGADVRVFAAMQRYFSRGPLQAYAYLLFVLIYFPCIAAFGAAIRELGKFYGIVLVAYLTLTAWIIAVLFYQITLGGSILWIAAALAMAAVIALAFRAMGRRTAARE